MHDLALIFALLGGVSLIVGSLWGGRWLTQAPQHELLCRIGLIAHLDVTHENTLANPDYDDCICVRCGRLHDGQQRYLARLTQLHQHLLDLGLIRTLDR